MRVKQNTNFLLSDKYIGNINTKLLKSILCTLRITENHTQISQDVLDLGLDLVLAAYKVLH